MTINNIIKELKEIENTLKKEKIPYYLIHIPPIKNITLRNKIMRKLFGRNKEGLLKNSEIISKNTFITDIKSNIPNLLEKNKIKFNKIKIWK